MLSQLGRIPGEILVPALEWPGLGEERQVQ